MGETHSKYIMWAAQDGRLEDLLYHLQGAGPEALEATSSLSPKLQSPIHLAAIRGHPRCIQALREAGSKLNKMDKDGYSPLHLAVANGHYSSVLVLLQLGAKVTLKNRFGVTPLHLAASIGHTPCMEEFLRLGADINAQESWGQTPLIITTLKNRIHCMKALIRLGANLEVTDHHHGNTALHVACASRDEEAVLVLLDAGADVLATNSSGKSSLGIALFNKFYRIVPLLVEYGARLNCHERKHLPQGLLQYMDSLTGSPLSLLRLCRVRIRQMLGPTALEEVLPALNLPPAMVDFVGQIRDLCEYGLLVKEAALQGGSEEYWRQKGEALREQRLSICV